MADSGHLYLDTNVLIALGEGFDTVSDLIQEIIGQRPPGESFLCTSRLSLSELLVHPFRQNNETLVDLYTTWITSTNWLTAGSVDLPVLQTAALIRAKYSSVKLPDAIHLSTAIALKCGRFISGDKKLPRRIELAPDRWGIVRGPVRVDVLPLDETTLRKLGSERP